MGSRLLDQEKGYRPHVLRVNVFAHGPVSFFQNLLCHRGHRHLELVAMLRIPSHNFSDENIPYFRLLIRTEGTENYDRNSDLSHSHN